MSFGNLRQALTMIIAIRTSDPANLSLLIQPEALRAPEVIVRAEWSPKIDIWNLGCLVSDVIHLPTSSVTEYPRRFLNLRVEENYLIHASTTRRTA